MGKKHQTPPTGTFLFRSTAGEVVYRIRPATLRVTRHPEEWELFFYVAAERGAKRTTTACLEDDATPNAEVLVFLEDFDVNALVGRRFEVPVAYDEHRQDHVATYYYYEHDDLEENVVEVLAREGTLLHVRWTGIAGRLMEGKTQVEIDSWFEFEGVAEEGGA